MGAVARTLKVRPGEGRTAALLTALMFLTSAGGSLGGNGIDTLFFARFGVRYLPHMYMVLGGVMLLVALGVTVLLNRVARERLFVLMPLALAAVLVAERAMVAVGPRWIYPVMWIAMNVIGFMQALLSWGLAGMSCDTRQAKRLFPLFGAGGILGAVLGGLGTAPLVNLVGTENLLFAWAVALGAAFAVGIALVGRSRPSPRKRRRRRASVVKEMQQGYRTVRASPFLRWTALGAAVFAVLIYSIAFPFSKAVTAEFPREESLAGFLGLFQGVSMGVAFLVSLFVANRLFARFGVMRMVVAFPVIYFVGFAVLTVTNAFPLVAGFRMLQMAWLMGVFASASQAAFNVVSPARKDQVRVFMDGVPAQAGTVAAGALLLVGQEALSARALSGIGLAAAAVALPVTVKAMRAYRLALVDALREGRPQVFFSEEQPFGGFQRDAAAVHAAIEGVSNPDRAIRRVSVEILGRIAGPEASDALVRALKDRDPPVRVAALHGLVQANTTQALLEVAGRLRDPEPSVRLEAVGALRALDPYAAGITREIRPMLADEDPAVRARVAATLLDLGPDEDAVRVLQSMAGDDDERVRCEAVACAAMARNVDRLALATAGMKDRAVPVREMAARALGSVGAVEPLIAALADPAPSVRREVATALAVIGEPAVGPAIRALDDPALEPGALDALQLVDELPTEAIERYARRAESTARYYGALWEAATRATNGDERTALLADALKTRALEHGIRTLRAAGLLVDRRATAVALDNLRSSDPAQRANALETLEAATPRHLAAGVLALWEPTDETVPAPEDWLGSALRDDDPWIRDLAAAAADRIPSAVDTLATLSVIERVMLLRRVPLFSDLSSDDLRHIADIATEASFSAEETIADEGEPGEEMYVVASGEVAAVLDLACRNERTIARHGPGGHVGEMALIGRTPRSASLVARTDTRTLVLDRAHFESLLRERPDVGLALMRTLVERVQEANLLLPSDLAARTEASPARGDRRFVTMLFCDVVGSTSMAEQLDPEEWADIVQEACSVLAAPVERYGGTLTQFMGDAILAVFGAPVAHENDAERAVRAGLDILTTIAPMKERLADRELPFDVRVGINTGLVRAGEVGGQRLTYSALGDAVNVAARMEQSAAPGTVQISETTAKLVAPLFDLEGLGKIEVKGKREPVGASRVLGLKRRPGKVRGVEGLTSPVVGRDEELATLREIITSVHGGVGHVVTLIGEAGLGKTRIIEEVHAAWRRLDVPEDRWIEARSVSYETNRPYALAAQFLLRASGSEESEDLATLKERAMAFVDVIESPDPARTRAVFALLLGLEVDGPYELPQGEELKRVVLKTMVEACRRWGARPGVVIADDLHWADPASVELMERLLTLATETPVLFVCAARPEPATLRERLFAAAPAERHTPIKLEPLEASETSTLVTQLLKIDSMPDELRSNVVGKAAGNPLFVEETLRALIDGGAVVPRPDGGWEVVGEASMAVPDQLQGLLAARVDRLEAGPRRTLQLAAVIGKSFGYRVLRSIALDPEDLGDHLDKLERAGLIVETAEEPDLEFGFKHPLLQEAAYGSMLVKERRGYHARVGEALERELGGREDHAATLAHHFDEAGDQERALHYRRAAAQRAVRLFAHAEAIAQYRRALELALSSGADVASLYRGLGQALQLAGDHAGALSVYETMTTEAVSRGDKAMELSAVTAAATVRAIPSERQDPEAALVLLDRALVLAEELGDRAAEGRAHWNRMLMMQFGGLDVAEAVAHGEVALTIARELGLQELQAYALHDMADSLFFLRRPEEAWPAFRESRALFEQLNNPTMVADSLGREAHLLMMAGRYAEAASRVEEALELNRRIANPWGVAYSTFVRMHVRWELGEREAAIADGRALIEVAVSASSLSRQGSSSDLAMMLGQHGDVQAGVELTSRAVAAGAASEPLRQWLLGAHARLLVVSGRLDEAEAAWRSSIEDLPREGSLIHMHMASHVWLAGAEIALARGERETARQRLEEIVRYTSERGVRWRADEIAALAERAGHGT